jgi:hypothetical protein
MQDTHRFVKISDSGAWCWFQDPRAVYIAGQKKYTYAGWVSRDGKLQVGAYNHATNQTEIVTIEDEWGNNDHNTNSFLVLPDNRIMIFYTQHNQCGLYSRTTLYPEDVSTWSEKITVSDKRRITYSHPVYLSDEGRFYVFWRGESWKPTFAVSEDGVVWSEPRILFQESGHEGLRIRPYLKVISDGKSEIHFAFTDGHPAANSENSIYYALYKHGIFYQANGAIIDTLDELPIQHSHSDLVFDGKRQKMTSWIWDIALNAKGAPVIAYVRMPKKKDHRYHYVSWGGEAWRDYEMIPGGPWFPKTPWFKKEKEPYYSGGITLNHADPSALYLSRQIGGVFEIEKWVTPDAGASWSSFAITKHSKYDNVRPVVPRGGECYTDTVLWMQGDYIHYTNFDTKIMMYALAHLA